MEPTGESSPNLNRTLTHAFPVKTRRICINLRSGVDMSNPVYPVATPMRGSGAEPWSGGQVRCFAPEAKSSLAFESPAAEQNVPDSGYVVVHTGVNHKAFVNKNSN